MTKKPKLYLCIHGHFYQPPRENPWTGKTQLEESAAPFHDWNERIFNECYKPNTEAVIVDDKGKVIKRVNNYEYLNFNFGPTLMEWMRETHKDTLQKIIEADKTSASNHSGFRNAIAQAYNHTILPLSNRKDKVTQVKWGLKYFEHFFGRKSQSMWLPETAANDETLEVLIDEGIRFIILDPAQASMIRKTGEKNWEDVSAGNINPKMTYRYFSGNKYIDIFFYDGPLSKALAFEDVAYSSEKLMTRIEQAKLKDFNLPQLISIAVDGETFGHHKKFSDRTIAYLLTKLAHQHDFKVTNFSEYLEHYPPVYEVILKPGEFDEGTSWSCLHGTSRWKSDCGDSTGGKPEWNQKWREPLRNSLNILNAKLDVIFHVFGKKYFKNPDDARNNYIDLMLNKNAASVKKFFAKNSPKPLSDKEISFALNLLEMQKYSMQMFTSCGWFFADISGLESQLVMKYARRAIEFAKEIADIDLESEFTSELKKAKSNIREYGNGKDIYSNIIREEKTI
jgi:alpha-amylase/alpha-mannosidase (GH57 family)